jgi:hypothetical protein
LLHFAFDYQHGDAIRRASLGPRGSRADRGEQGQNDGPSPQTKHFVYAQHFSSPIPASQKADPSLRSG